MNDLIHPNELLGLKKARVSLALFLY